MGGGVALVCLSLCLASCDARGCALRPAKCSVLSPGSPPRPRPSPEGPGSQRLLPQPRWALPPGSALTTFWPSRPGAGLPAHFPPGSTWRPGLQRPPLPQATGPGRALTGCCPALAIGVPGRGSGRPAGKGDGMSLPCSFQCRYHRLLCCNFLWGQGLPTGLGLHQPQRFRPGRGCGSGAQGRLPQALRAGEAPLASKPACPSGPWHAGVGGSEGGGEAGRGEVGEMSFLGPND